MEQPTSARLGTSFLKGIAGFCVFGVLALYIRSGFNQEKTYDEGREATRLNNLSKLHKEDSEKLVGYRWVDKSKGIVQIPITQAMVLTLADLKAKGVVASSVKAEPNAVNVVPPYLQAKTAPSAP